MTKVPTKVATTKSSSTRAQNAKHTHDLNNKNRHTLVSNSKVHSVKSYSFAPNGEALLSFPCVIAGRVLHAHFKFVY